MRNVLIALAAVLICIGIGSALGNPAGGFIVGVVLGIVLPKRGANPNASA